MTVEIKTSDRAANVIGSVQIEFIWIYSRIELCKHILKDLEKERIVIDAALKESQRILSVIHEPFPPIQGFEIAAKACEERDLNADPVTFLEDPFKCKLPLTQATICTGSGLYGKKSSGSCC